MTLLSKRFKQSYVLLLFTIPLLLLFTLSSAPIAFSKTSSLDTVDLGMHYEIFKDPTNSVTIDELIEGSYRSSFTPSEDKYLSFLHTDDTIWLKLNAADIMKNRDQMHWLEYNDKIESLNMYVVNEDGSYELYESGLSNLEKQPLAYPSLLFPIDSPEVKEIYLQLNSQLPLTIFTKLYSNTGFIENVASYKMYTGIFYGFILALALYNLILYFSFKERSYLYYTLYMFSFMLYQGTMNSFDVELFGHIASPWFLTKTLGLSCNLMIVFMTLFGKEFLEIKQHLPRSNRFLNLAIGLAGISTIAMFAGVSQHYTDIFVTSMGLVVLLFLWISAVRLLLKGRKSARFYILGWSFLLGSMVIQALVMLGIIPLSWAVFEEIPAYSAMFEALILSLALADKINLIMKDNRRTQKELNETLERKVLERTRELKEIQVELEHLANTDRLTQLPNRVLLDRVLEKQFAYARTESTPLSIMLIDLDHFKSVNDTFGHQIGDEVLVKAAQLFQSSVRDCDTVGRWGGEEFLVICPSTTLAEALHLAETLRAKLADVSFNEIGKKTASFGVATQIDGDTLHSIISRSDQALYAAKANGRNRVEYMKVKKDEVMSGSAMHGPDMYPTT